MQVQELLIYIKEWRLHAMYFSKLKKFNKESPSKTIGKNMKTNINTIQISISGDVGCGKSHILTVIEKALKAEYGHDLMVASRDLYLERNLNSSDDQMEKINKANTVIVLSE
jgi:ABC-type lipoprotein export system ATPase subunit